MAARFFAAGIHYHHHLLGEISRLNTNCKKPLTLPNFSYPGIILKNIVTRFVDSKKGEVEFTNQFNSKNSLRRDLKLYN